MLMRESITVMFFYSSSTYTVKLNYWFYSQSEGSFSPPSHPGRVMDKLGKFILSSNGNEETKANAVPSEHSFSMCGGWCIMGHVREQRLWWTSRMVCWSTSVTGQLPAAPPGENPYEVLKLAGENFCFSMKHYRSVFSDIQHIYTLHSSEWWDSGKNTW